MGNLFSFNILIAVNSLNNSRSCNIYQLHRNRPNSTWLMGISSQEYEGIPENLVVNLIAMFVFFSAFIVMRRVAWKYSYGRMSSNLKDDLGCSDALTVRLEEAPEQGMGEGEFNASGTSNSSPSNVDTSEHKNVSCKESLDAMEQRSENASSTKEPIKNTELVLMDDDTGDIEDIGYFSWIKMVLTMSDQIYLEKCGPDCVAYLSFQRHLILLAIFITTTSLLVILPINMYAETTISGPTFLNETRIRGFAKLTIVNLDNNHIYCFWPHIVLANIYVFVSIAVMKRFSRRMRVLTEDSNVISHTIRIIGITKTMCQEDIFRAYFYRKFPGIEILEVSFAYNVSKLRKLEAERMRAQSAKEFYEKRYMAAILRKGEITAKRPKIRPYPLGIIGCCFGCKCWGICQCKKVDAIDYYTAREARFLAKVEEERLHALSQPLGIAYITFRNVAAAELVVDAYSCCSNEFKDDKSAALKTVLWSVSFAPAPEVINWHNMSVNVAWWWIRCVLVNCFVILFVVIFSTPTLILLFWTPQFLYKRDYDDKIWERLTDSFLNTIPSFVLWMVGSTLIYLVDQSDSLIGYWTKTAGHLSEMLKEYMFLVIMVCLMPALGFRSLVEILDENAKFRLRWHCIFYPENGATFVKYVCTSGLCGIIAELIRIPTTFLYAVRIFLARSVAEKDACRKATVNDYPVGHNYAWVLLHFTLFSCYSVIYPLITPFGLIYFIAKHFIDRYHIYFSYKPCKVEKNVHATAVYLVLFSMWLLHLNLFLYLDLFKKFDPFSYKHEAIEVHLRALTMFSFMGLCLTTALYLGQRFWEVCIEFSSFQYSENPKTDGRGDEQLIGMQGTSEDHPSAKVIPQEDTKSNDNDEKQNREQGAFESESKSNVKEFGDERSKTLADRQPSQPTSSFYTGTDPDRTHNGTERTIANNYAKGEQPYGRYIAPLLRPEFIRLAQTTTP